MKNLIVGLTTLFALSINGQNKVGYHYDLNGNRDQRFFIGFRPEKTDSLSSLDSVLTNMPGNPAISSTQDKTPETIALEKGITVYPNPTRDLVMVVITKAGMKQNSSALIYLIDNSGKLIETKSYLGSEISFDLSKNPPGNYYLKIVFENNERLVYNVIKIN